MSLAKRVPAGLGGALFLIGSACAPQILQITAPHNGALLDDPVVAFDVSVPANYVPTSAVVRVDGVDLIAALGLTPPFAGAGGSVVIGGAAVSVTSFSYSIPPSGLVEVSAHLQGLAVGDHTLDARAQQTVGGPTAKMAAFSVVGPFSLGQQVLASAGTPPPPPVVTPGNHAGSVTLGEPLAAPPVGIAGGGQLCPGFVPAARGRAGGP